jgi:hypothetical protein
MYVLIAREVSGTSFFERKIDFVTLRSNCDGEEGGVRYGFLAKGAESYLRQVIAKWTPFESYTGVECYTTHWGFDVGDPMVVKIGVPR